MRFSLDGLCFAFSADGRLGCAETLRPTQLLWPSCKWHGKADFEILGFLFLPQAPFGRLKGLVSARRPFSR